MSYLLDILPYLLSGLKVTLLVFSFTLLAIPLGFILAMLHKWGPIWFKKILDLYTWIMRGTPLLLQLFFVVYGLPILLGSFFRFGELEAAILTFILNYSAYFLEIFRGGMNAIPKNQYEAAQVLSLTSKQSFIYVIMPQALKKTIPSVTNEIITLIKDTALVSAVAISDLMRNTKEVVAHDFRVDGYLIAGIIYLVLTYVIVYLMKKVEKKYAFYA